MGCTLLLSSMCKVNTFACGRFGLTNFTKHARVCHLGFAGRYEVVHGMGILTYRNVSWTLFSGQRLSTSSSFSLTHFDWVTPWSLCFRHAQVMKNATLPPSKRSRIEHQMDKMIIFMFALLFAMCLVGATLFAIWTKSLSPKMWYLEPKQAPTAFNPSQPLLAGVYSFVTSFVLYGYLIPISLYVSLEMVKVCQACFSLSVSSTPALLCMSKSMCHPIMALWGLMMSC